MTDYPAPYPVDPPGPGAYPSVQAAPRWAAGSERDLTVSVGTARTALLQAIRSLDFATTSEQYSVIEAERGSKLRGLSLTRTRVPVAVRVGITPAGTGCALEIRVEDRWPTSGRTPAAAAVYGEVFTEVLTRIDEQLKQADPNSAPAFPLWWRSLPEALAAAGAAGADASARLDAALQRRTSRLLDGPRRAPRPAAVGAGVRTVTFAAPDAVAQIAADVVDGMLTAGQLVAGAPGKMPPPLVEQVQAMVVQLEARLAEMARSPMSGDLALPVADADRPVVTFLYQQAALREKLPVRILMTCTTCRLEKVVNPDFVRLRERNRRVRVLQSSVGAVFGSHNISPFILVGRLAAVKKTDPDFVCQRCQGTDADEKPITFCPRCGDRRVESVLRTCSKCELDLRTVLPGRTVWQEVEPAPAADPEPPPGPGDESVADLDTQDEAGGAEAAGDGPSVDWTPPPPPPPPPPPAAGAWAPPTITAAPRRAPRPVATPAGWFPDPWQRFEVRYFDGRAWTMHVGAGGVTMLDTPEQSQPESPQSIESDPS